MFRVMGRQSEQLSFDQFYPFALEQDPSVKHAINILDAKLAMYDIHSRLFLADSVADLSA